MVGWHCQPLKYLMQPQGATEGSYANLKLTTREDLLMLSALIDAEYDEE